VAADDALKAIGMFRGLGVPQAGLVENMSYFVCGTCDTQHDLFGRGGGRRLALAAGVPFLGEIPLETTVREGGDQGSPAVLRPTSPAGRALDDLAGRIWTALQIQDSPQERRQQ
jgi:ATP-binding protein involved in chromosome partitioning